MLFERFSSSGPAIDPDPSNAVAVVPDHDPALLFQPLSLSPGLRRFINVAVFSVLAIGFLAAIVLSPHSASAQYPGGGYPGSGYYAVSYSGGTMTNQVTGAPPTSSGSSGYYLNTNSGEYGGVVYTQANAGQTATVSCSGPITVTLTWENGGNSSLLPPVTSWVEEQCTVTWAGPADSGPDEGVTPATGSCSNPLGGTETNDSPGPGQVWTWTEYRQINNPNQANTVTFEVNPSANATWENSGTYYGDPSASVGLRVTPTTFNGEIIPDGATEDSSGNWHILIGQQCQPTLSGLPGGDVTSNYQWGVTGSTCQSWTIGPTTTDPIQEGGLTNFVDGPGPLNGPNASVNPPIPPPSWYWYDKGNNNFVPETISCSVTLTPPAGQGSPFNVSLSKLVFVWIPEWDCTGTPGEMNVITSGSPDAPDYLLKAVPSTSPYDGGMVFQADVTSPNPALFGDGSAELAQLVIPGYTQTTTDGTMQY